MVKRIERCRISGSTNLISILSLGHSSVTGVFPASKDVPVTAGPLELVWCPESGLVQLATSYDANEMYGENYGYRSSLNLSMVRHLTNKINKLEQSAQVRPGDVVLDIGSNDATSLKAYKTTGITRIGIDPSGEKFRKYYPDDISLVPDFFSAANFSRVSSTAPKSSRRSRCSTIWKILCSLRKKLPNPSRPTGLAFRAELHAVDAAHDVLRYDLSRTSRVLFSRRGPEDPGRGGYESARRANECCQRRQLRDQRRPQTVFRRGQQAGHRLAAGARRAAWC